MSFPAYYDDLTILITMSTLQIPVSHCGLERETWVPVSDLHAWFSHKKLAFNPSKSEALFLGPPRGWKRSQRSVNISGHMNMPSRQDGRRRTHYEACQTPSSRFDVIRRGMWMIFHLNVSQVDFKRCSSSYKIVAVRGRDIGWYTSHVFSSDQTLPMHAFTSCTPSGIAIKTTACTSSLLFPLLLSLSCCCNMAAVTRLLQRGFSNVLLQRCCCCCFFSVSLNLRTIWHVKKLYCIVFGSGCSGLIKYVAALDAVDNTSAVEVGCRLSFSSLLFAEMRICISCQLHRILYQKFNLKSLEGSGKIQKDPPFTNINATATD